MSIVTFRELFKKNRKVIGTAIHIPAEEVIEAVGHCGYDMVCIDTEHTPFGMETAQRLILAAYATDICPIVRVSTNNADWVRKALDAGAKGIVFPNIATAEDAKNAVALTKYAPMGIRGACPNVRAAKYGKRGPGFYNEANDETAVILLIEHIDGFMNFDSIIQVPGIDAIYLGPYDLSVSMELPGQVYHPEVYEKLIIMMKKAKAEGLLVGTYSLNVEKAKEWLNEGMDFIYYNTDVTVLSQKYMADLEYLLKK